MLDTVTLRFHGILDTKTNTLDLLQKENKGVTVYAVDEHHELYKKMLVYKGRFFNMTKRLNQEVSTTENMTESDILQMEKGKAQGMTIIKQVMRFVDERQVKETNAKINGKYSVPSSVSDVVFNINENGSFIDFTFSIPKYLYGHSLAEFIPQGGSANYFKMKNPFSLNSQRKILYQRLKKLIDKFCLDLATRFELDTMPNKDYIEIRRLDLCYNQYFDSKKDCLLFLNAQKKLVKKKATHGNAKLDSYETSLTYFTSKGSYFKIYHKGTEYAQSNGDLKKHLKFNAIKVREYLSKENAVNNHIKASLENLDYVEMLFKKQAQGDVVNIPKDKIDEVNRQAKILKKINPYDTQFLKEQMDKVLRYEVSLRGDFFAYQYKTKLFRKDCSEWQRHMACYKKGHRNANTDYIEPNERQSKFDRDKYREVEKYLKRSLHFVLGENHFIDKFSKTGNDYIKSDVWKVPKFDYRYTTLQDKDIANFSDDFLQICITHFFSLIKNFQADIVQNYDDVRLMVDKYNDDVDQRVKEYNALNMWRVKSVNLLGEEKYIIKGNKIIRKPVGLLTASEKSDLRLKKINKMRVLQILRELEQGKSLLQVRKELGIHKSTFSRLKKDLEIFNIYETTVKEEISLNPKLDFHQYYFNTGSDSYRQKFYINEKQYQNG